MAAQCEVDEVVVDRLCLGYRTTSTKAERIEAVRDMTERGLSASWIAMSLRMTPRTIQRYRAIQQTFPQPEGGLTMGIKMTEHEAILLDMLLP